MTDDQYVDRNTDQLFVGGEEGSTSYAKVVTYLYGGKTDVGLPSKVRFIAHVSASTYDVRIFDVTNSLVISESLARTENAPAIWEMPPLANIPDTPAIWEVQVRRTSGSPKSVFVESVEFLY